MIATPTQIRAFQAPHKKGAGSSLSSLKSASDLPQFDGSAPLSLAFIRSGLQQTWNRLAPNTTIPGDLAGSLYRPRTAAMAHRLLGGAESTMRLSSETWYSILAVELAHQASLIHDDAIEQAVVRRGKTTTYGELGIGGAIVTGDRVLGMGYLSASKAENNHLQQLYNRSILRVIEGEEEQARWGGKIVPFTSYVNILDKKTGSLFGFAFAAPFILANQSHWRSALLFGHRLGVLYQMLDDILDYCPAYAYRKASHPRLPTEKMDRSPPAHRRLVF